MEHGWNTEQQVENLSRNHAEETSRKGRKWWGAKGAKELGGSIQNNKSPDSERNFGG